MTPEERQVITAIFERLRTAENHPRDPEAERLIADLVARQPYAPYAMAQSLYVSEQALLRLNSRISELEAQLQEARSKPQSGGFLSGLFGGDPPEPRPTSPGSGSQYPQGQPGYAPDAPASPAGSGRQSGPWGGQAQSGPWGAPAQGGGFLHNALTTAAGVAGGMVVANALSSAFSGHGWGSPGLGGLGSGFGSPTNDIVDQAFAAGERTGRDETLAQQDQRDDQQEDQREQDERDDQYADASDASFDDSDSSFEDDNSSDGLDYSTDV
ncbi:DUF2076 domain-containing protein [Mesorhizobium sp. B4-1-3]|uniref:DUF2076 domain-containing protein n=1 Tax=Mesorhizobium sp. B4-1-3 TaxID=2589889 RepID=UPI001126F999|nr:DUF2076 domain-containing protein [Mesorhizobium sp. B4-1-3]TPI11628.1 DUF2076 domain-containing protein [Mesorhizobium sp. B4-1-3]